jgi:hypothetical protein
MRVRFYDTDTVDHVVMQRGSVVPATMSADNSVIFSAEVYDYCEGFSDRYVLLDTCAGESVFKNKNLFYFTEPSPTPMIISGVNPKGKPLVITEYGETDFGYVYYEPKCVANILSFGNIVNDSVSVVYNHRHDCYVVQVKQGDKCYRFSRDRDSNIYLCDLDTMISEPRLAMVTTVEHNKNKYSKRQIKQAELAREYQRKLGYASPGQLIKMIGQGQLTNSNITAQDVVRAIDIYGPDLGSLKGKTTSHKAQLEEETPILRTKLFESQTMYLDLMFVNGLPFLIAVVNPLEYVMVNKLSKRDNWTLWGSIESNVNHITKYGFKIKMVRVDGEGAISTDWFDSRISSLGAVLDTTGAGEAVAVVERKIRQVKERVRAVVNTLPYTLTEKLEGWLVRYAVNRIVLVPTRNSVDQVSPREKLFGRKLNVDKELKHGFGDYVQVHADNIDNSMKPRTQGAIALMSAGNLEGSWYYFLLSNEQIVKRTKATPLPMSDVVIAHLNSLSANRKISKTNNVRQPVFEQNNHTIDDNDDDYDNEIIDHAEPDMLHPHDLPYDDEHVDNELQYELDVPDEVPDEMHGHYENDDIIDQLLEEIDNDAVNDFTEYDDTPVNNQALLDDIFGVDSDDDIDVVNDIDEMNVEPDVDIEPEPAVVPVLRRSARNHQPGKWNKKYVGLNTFRHDMSLRTFVLNMSISESIEKFGDTAVDSITKEIKQMLDKHVWEGVMLDSLTPKQKKGIITSSMFGKAKYTADGTFDKFKSRIVAGGHLQDRNVYDNGSSPTACTTSVFIVAAIAAKENRAVATIDFPGAFLNSDMPLDGDHVVFMRINKYLTNVLTSLDPAYKKFVNANGTCVVKLKKALYGCVESAKLWYDKLSADLTKLGYKRNNTDICVFNRTESNNKQTTLVIHVDDMMITTSDDKNLDKIITEIENLYPGLTKNRGKVLNYIGMTFNFEVRGKVKITMEGFIKDLLDTCQEIVGVSAIPGDPKLFTVGKETHNSLLPNHLREFFHSIVAKLLYLSKRIRPDILTEVAFLTKRVLAPQRDDYDKLMKTIKYIRGTRELALTLEMDDPVHVTSYIDASYSVHMDKKSHTGCVITLGKGAISCKSSTQKLNTMSSTEAEFVAASEGLYQVIWSRNFLLEQGYQISPATVYQDNLSTIHLIKNGRSNSERTRHIEIRYFFITDRIERGEIQVIYKPTQEMIADIMTKPLTGNLFRRLRDLLLNST